MAYKTFVRKGKTKIPVGTFKTQKDAQRAANKVIDKEMAKGFRKVRKITGLTLKQRQKLSPKEMKKITRDVNKKVGWSELSWSYKKV